MNRFAQFPESGSIKDEKSYLEAFGLFSGEKNVFNQPLNYATKSKHPQFLSTFSFASPISSTLLAPKRCTCKYCGTIYLTTDPNAHFHRLKWYNYGVMYHPHARVGEQLSVAFKNGGSTNVVERWDSLELSAYYGRVYRIVYVLFTMRCVEPFLKSLLVKHFSKPIGSTQREGFAITQHESEHFLKYFLKKHDHLHKALCYSNIAYSTASEKAHFKLDFQTFLKSNVPTYHPIIHS